MTQDEIIEMANQAGAVSGKPTPDAHEIVFTQCLDIYRFAKLIAAKERNVIEDEYWSCIQSDLEHGVKSLSEKAAKDFARSMPELNKFGTWLEARGEA